MSSDKDNYICKSCRNLLVELFTPNSYQLECKKCSIVYDITPEGTLLFEEVSENIISLYHKKLENILNDPLNIRIFEFCSNCKKEQYIKTSRIGNELNLIKICETCKRWLS